ncbi:hypothetical protein TRVA0_017S00584 [Trichomonascus vanleenenianus]|uniref:uncharacterized protein n=1 Tax=Trichomonascus vanleenenianus TaxID=2268995 RepID=UPI003ECB3207
MSSLGALPQTLKSITATKVTELSKQRDLFNKKRDEILQAAEAASDAREKAQVLLEGVSRLKGFPYDAFDGDDLDEDITQSQTVTGISNCTDRAIHANIRRFLLQSKHDSSVSSTAIQGYVDELETELRGLTLKHEQASFFSSLVKEWLNHLEEDSTASKSDFQNVGRAEMHRQRQEWESLVFADSTVDAEAVKNYLDELFQKETPSRQALKNLREELKRFATDLSAERAPFTVHSMKWVSNALFKQDLLSKEKNAILKEFMRNKDVMQELADVLNMRMTALESWNWDPQGVPMEMRRQLNGKYRVFMDEDILDALMIQYVGTRWGVALRSAFATFSNSQAWKWLRDNIPRRERDRRRYFIGEDSVRDGGVHEMRKKTYKEDYFMSMLPLTLTSESSGSYGDEESDDEYEKAKNPLETKHALLHLLIAESLIHKKVHGQFTAIRSDFKWFGPSLSHNTILTVLTYFGIPDTWIKFFQTFLEAPLRFVEDGSGATIHVRKKGVPMSHTLSTCFGEAVLFCMDYAVSRKTEGAYLYRLHDDFWFWGREDTCMKAWEAMAEFADVMGLEFNEDKTGSVQMGPSGDSNANSVLPRNKITWGFLYLDPEEGRFVIDQNLVDNHIAELKHQLSSCKSVFSWITAWNSYFARFFSNNFGRPAMCFGRKHIDMAIETLHRIETTLFSGSGPSSLVIEGTKYSGATDYLRYVIHERFDASDLPEGFFYFPIELGGLELRNPYIPLLAMRESIKQSPEKCLEKAFINDEMNYYTYKETFEKHGPNKRHEYANLRAENEDISTFMSLDEFSKYPETRSVSVRNAYKALIEIPSETSLNQTAELQRHLNSLAESNEQSKITPTWHSMTPYWRWIAELYHADMVKKYGGLAALDRQSMPIGVVKTLKEGKFRWQS